MSDSTHGNLPTNIVKLSAFQYLYKFGKQHNCLDALVNVFDAPTYSKLKSNIIKFTTDVDCTNYEFGKSLEDCQNKVKGDLAEVFFMHFLAKCGVHYNIMDLEGTKHDAIGVDYIGIDFAGKPLAIQAKFVSNPTELFESGRLETFFMQAHSKHPVLITTAQNIAGRYRRHQQEGKLTIIDDVELKKWYGEGFRQYLLTQTKATFGYIGGGSFREQNNTPTDNQ